MNKPSMASISVRETAWRVAAMGLIILLAVAACRGGEGESAASSAEPTVIFAGDECTYDGPGTVPAGQVSVNWDVEGQPRDLYGLAIVTLHEGKTFEDLDAWPSIGAPSWARVLRFAERAPDDRSPVVADVSEGPIFLVCFTADPKAKIGVLGPLEVED
jgi:hypothetical protein